MTPEFRQLRLRQLERAMVPFLGAKDSPRPQRGWIHAIREATGIPLRKLSQRLHKSLSLIISLERSEAEYRITLGSLRDAADALGCQLVYALVPKNGSMQELAEERVHRDVAENVRAVEHSMALEDQAVGGVRKKIEEETQRILKRRRK
jgi:predicted DNA-binding mobile mystery protein A